MKHILVTGAGQGLGYHMVDVLLQETQNFVFAGIRTQTQEIIDLQKKFQDRLVVTSLEVTSEESVKEMLQIVQKQTDKIDILVNNAAVYLEKNRPEITGIEITDMLKSFDVNAAGPARMIKHFLPLVEKSERKLIANISSEAGSITDCPRRLEYGYCMSKAALNMLTRLVQNLVKDRGIKVLSIHPGWLQTQMGGKNADLSPKDVANLIIQKLTAGELSTLPIYMDYTGKAMNW